MPTNNYAYCKQKTTQERIAAMSVFYIGYGIGRFLIEGLRTDSLYIFPGLRVSQILSLILVVVGFIL